MRFKPSVNQFFLQPHWDINFRIFRIGVATLLLVQAAQIWPVLDLLYGPQGLVVNGSTFLAQTAIYGLFGIYTAAVVALGIDWKTQSSSVLVWVLHLVFFSYRQPSSYGFDLFSSMSLFYIALNPIVGDAMKRILQIHLSLIYLATGLGKASGSQWWTGEAILRALMQPQLRQFDLTPLAHCPNFARALSLSTLLIEVGYCFFVWNLKTSRIWVLMTIGLHLGIAVFMGLYLFSFLMILLNVVAFGPRLKFTPLFLSPEAHNSGDFEVQP